MSFDVALANVLSTLLFILPGYLAAKGKKAAAEHLPTLSGLLIYVCAPCMVFATIMSLENLQSLLGGMALFFVVSIIVQALFMGLLWLLFRRKYADARYRILTMCGVLGNVGFFGLPIIRALLPTHPEAACYSAMFMVSMNVFVFTMAVFCLTGDPKAAKLKAAVINPNMLGFVAAMAVYFLHGDKWMPELVTKAVGQVGNMTTPLCMMILGIRLSGIRLTRLFTRPFVYIICLTKLLAFPVFAYALTFLLPVDTAFRASVLILCGTPCASVTLGMAEMLNAEQELTANCVLLSTLMSFMTIPLLTLLV